MEVTLGFESSQGAPEEANFEEARSLNRWLRDEPELRGAVVRPASADPGAGNMGEALEALNVVLANGIALASLVTAIATWRDSRRTRPTVRIERGNTSVVIEGGSADDIRRIVAQLDPPAGDTEQP